MVRFWLDYLDKYKAYPFPDKYIGVLKFTIHNIIGVWLVGVLV